MREVDYIFFIFLGNGWFIFIWFYIGIGGECLRFMRYEVLINMVDLLFLFIKLRFYELSIYNRIFCYFKEYLVILFDNLILIMVGVFIRRKLVKVKI